MHGIHAANNWFKKFKNSIAVWTSAQFASDTRYSSFAHVANKPLTSYCSKLDTSSFRRSFFISHLHEIERCSNYSKRRRYWLTLRIRFLRELPYYRVCNHINNTILICYITWMSLIYSIFLLNIWLNKFDSRCPHNRIARDTYLLS